MRRGAIDVWREMTRRKRIDRVAAAQLDEVDVPVVAPGRGRGRSRTRRPLRRRPPPDGCASTGATRVRSRQRPSSCHCASRHLIAPDRRAFHPVRRCRRRHGMRTTRRRGRASAGSAAPRISYAGRRSSREPDGSTGTARPRVRGRSRGKHRSCPAEAREPSATIGREATTASNPTRTGTSRRARRHRPWCAAHGYGISAASAVPLTRNSPFTTRSRRRRTHGRGEPRPQGRDQALDAGSPSLSGERERAGREDLGARRGLVVRHLRGEAGPEEVRDLGEDLDAGRRVRRRAGRSRSRRAEASRRPAGPCPRRATAAGGVRTIQGPGALRGRCRGTATPISAASGRPRSRHAPSASSRRRAGRPARRSCSPRGRRGCRRGRGSRSTRSYSCVVTYSWWPGKTIRSYALASAAPSRSASRSASERKSTCASVRRASAGTAGRSRK